MFFGSKGAFFPIFFTAGSPQKIIGVLEAGRKHPAEFSRVFLVSILVWEGINPRHPGPPPEKMSFGPLFSPPEVRPLTVPFTPPHKVFGGFWKTREIYPGSQRPLKNSPLELLIINPY